MALTELCISGYRSLRDVRLPLRQLNVIAGANGSGKSNLYRALSLIAKICEGEFARTLAREGGLLSAFWAGPRTSKKAHRLVLGFRAEDFAFELACGFPQPSIAATNQASERSQVWVTTHSGGLAGVIGSQSGILPTQLRLESGETVIDE